jgi:hypothetical protein
VYVRVPGYIGTVEWGARQALQERVSQRTRPDGAASDI